MPKIDGRSAKTASAGDFPALELPQGEHRIKLTYCPAGFSAGWG